MANLFRTAVQILAGQFGWETQLIGGLSMLAAWAILWRLGRANALLIGACLIWCLALSIFADGGRTDRITRMLDVFKPDPSEQYARSWIKLSDEMFIELGSIDQEPTISKSLNLTQEEQQRIWDDNLNRDHQRFLREMGRLDRLFAARATAAIQEMKQLHRNVPLTLQVIAMRFTNYIGAE